MSAAWFSRRRQLVVIGLLVAAGSGIAWSHRNAERGFIGGAIVALPYSASIGAGILGDWVSAREAQAQAIAALVSTIPSGERATRVVPLLEALQANGAFVAAQYVRGGAPPAPLRIGTHDDTLTTVDFSAPVGRVGAIDGFIVLRATITEAAFTQFNAAAPDDETQRTTLLDAGSESARLLVVSAPGGRVRLTHATASIPAGALLPDALRAALRDSSARTAGVHRGVMGADVVFARARVSGTTWWLLRERDVAELHARLRPSLLVSDAILAALALFGGGVLLLAWRSAWMRRERDTMTLRATFVSSMSHELRTPLTQIRMYAELLRLRLLPTGEDTDRALAVIEKEAGRLSHMVDRSLAFVRTGRADDAPDAPVGCDVAIAAHDAVASMAPLAAERHVTLSRDVPEGLQVRIGSDALHQVFINLLDNALKYGPHGQQVTITAWRDGGHVHIAVDDDGPGVPASERTQVWRAFVRGETARQGDAAGSGIGLAVVHDLITRAGGSATLTDAPPPRRGARVLLALAAVPTATHAS